MTTPGTSTDTSQFDEAKGGRPSVVKPGGSYDIS